MNPHPNEPHVLLGDPAQYNVEAIARLEREAMHQRTATEKFSDAITNFAGSITFLVLQLLAFVAWAVVNLGLIPGAPVFDPFPFGILTLVVSAEGVFLAIFILIRQNRMSRQSDRRAQLDLQINMLSEQEQTMILRMQQMICRHFGIPVDAVEREAQQYTERTDVGKLVDQLDEQLSSE